MKQSKKKKKRSRVSKSCNRAKIAGHKEKMTLKQLSDAFGSVTMTEAASELTEGNSLISSSSLDRISELPQPIVQHILCFLSQDEAAQTCLLSKSWRHHWCGRPILEFRKNLFRCNSETFLTIMDQTLERYHRQNLSIKRFVVEISSSVGDDELILLLEKWIPIVLINMGVETLHLVLAYSDYCFALPSVPLVFLKELYLEGCNITSADHNHNLCLKHLQTLSLHRVYIVDEALEKIMAGSPLVERLDLFRCEGLTNVKVNSSLQHFDCFDSSRNIEIKVPSALETIRVDSIRWCLNCYHINNHRFHSLKFLCLSHVQLSEELSNTFSCNSPCLEDLRLIDCSGFNNVKILSQSVKLLFIADTKDQIKTITIDAPGILCFSFSCSSSLPSISFATVTSREWESCIVVSFQLESNHIVMLSEVLMTLRQSRITLMLFCDAWAQLSEDINYVGCYGPVVVEHLNLELFDLDDDDDDDDYDDDDFAALFNCLFRIFHPRYIYIKMCPKPNASMHSHINNITKFIWKISLEDGEFSRCYPWQQELKESRCHLLDKYSGQWQPVFELMEIQRNETIRFGFEWRESWPCLCG